MDLLCFLNGGSQHDEGLRVYHSELQPKMQLLGPTIKAQDFPKRDKGLNTDCDLTLPAPVPTYLQTLL
jgi:hypothetical protein